jgi:hypothetical protein
LPLLREQTGNGWVERGRERSQAASSSASSGSQSANPCAASAPSAASSARVSSVATPSARTSTPKLFPSPIAERTIVASSALSSIASTNERSILISLTGSWRK